MGAGTANSLMGVQAAVAGGLGITARHITLTAISKGSKQSASLLLGNSYPAGPRPYSVIIRLEKRLMPSLHFLQARWTK
jgi:hypothetical protein